MPDPSESQVPEDKTASGVIEDAPTLEAEAADPTQDTQDVQEQLEESERKEPQKYGAFAGVFIPTLLTILGVILFVRQGWVVGNAGLLGAGLVIILSFGITAFTGLSMSCFVSNVRVRGGGAFSMISQSLGLEVGGAIGLPLYLSQALVVAMYIFGFRAGAMWVVDGITFPDSLAIVEANIALLIDLFAFGLIYLVAFISTGFAFRVQYLITAIVAGSLISVALAAYNGSMQYDITWWGDFPGAPENGFPGTTFWAVFAVFFPAATGIMAGANMSGELKNPRKAIATGTMAAIGLSLIIYLALAYWLARSVTMDELINNYTVMIDKAFWGPAVLGGLLAATFSSGLASFVGAPRILQALGNHGITPASQWVASRNRAGEPRNAFNVTAVIVLLALIMRDLNMIAPVVTMTFLITYAMINFIVFMEQTLQLPSFRPTFPLPRIIPFLGLVGCVAVMFIINPLVSLLSIVIILGLFIILMQKKLNAPFGDVRSGLFVALAEWAARKVQNLRSSSKRAWRPSILLATEEPNKVEGMFRLVKNIARPVGWVLVLGIVGKDKKKERRAQMEQRLQESAKALMDQGVFTSSTVNEGNNFTDAVISSMQTLRGSFFQPNLLMLELPADKKRHEELGRLIHEAYRYDLGTALVVEHNMSRLGQEKRINIWLPDQSDTDWNVHMEFENMDLSLLLGHRLYQSWNGKITLIQLVNHKKDRQRADDFAHRLAETGRIPADIQVLQPTDNWGRFTPDAPRGDINIMPLPEDKIDADFLWHIRDETGSSCIFTRDGGRESILA